MAHWGSITDERDAVVSGKTTAVEQVQKALKLVDDAQEYNATLALASHALDQAKAVDARIKAGEDVGPLAGVPFIAKDNFLTIDTETTASSNILKGFSPPFNATAIDKLEAAGAILVAKANLDSFAHGASTENSDFGPTNQD